MYWDFREHPLSYDGGVTFLTTARSNLGFHGTIHYKDALLRSNIAIGGEIGGKIDNCGVREVRRVRGTDFPIEESRKGDSSIVSSKIGQIGS